MSLCDENLTVYFCFFSERGRWTPRESSGTPQSCSGHSEAGGKVHPQGPGGDGVTLWENEVGEASATEQLSPVGFFCYDAQLPCLSSCSLLAICSGLFLISLSEKQNKQNKQTYCFSSHILLIMLLPSSVASLIFVRLDTTTLDKH